MYQIKRRGEFDDYLGFHETFTVLVGRKVRYQIQRGPGERPSPPKTLDTREQLSSRVIIDLREPPVVIAMRRKDAWAILARAAERSHVESEQIHASIGQRGVRN